MVLFSAYSDMIYLVTIRKRFLNLLLDIKHYNLLVCNILLLAHFTNFRVIFKCDTTYAHKVDKISRGK